MNKMDKKQELFEIMKEYVDEHNRIDIAKFREEHQKEYALLPHYFGSVNNAIAQYGWVKYIKAQHKGGKGMILRDQLAYDMLNLLRKGGKVDRQTLEEIANKYEVTRPAINQLHKALESTFEKTVKENTDNA